MAQDYISVNNYSRLGRMGISRRAFETIAEKATNEVKFANVANKSSHRFSLRGPVIVSFRKDGRVDIDIDVSIAEGAKVQEVCLEIQHNVANAIQMMCETVPFNIQVKVISIS